MMQNHTMQDKKRKCNSSAPASNARCVAMSLYNAFPMHIATNAQAKIYLVAVGISDYPGVANDLTLPANDAKTIAWLYSQNSHVKYSLLLNSDATKDRIVKAMSKLYSEATANDIVVFFFSGHGYPGGFVAHDAMLDYQVIRKAMASTNCRNSQNSRASAKKANVMLFLSSRSNEVSIERRDMKNGFFTTYLVQGLRGGADANRDRTITAKERFTSVHSGVIKLSRNMQHPVMWGKFSNDMPVIKW